MSLTLYVDGDRFRAHLRTTLARHPDLVPVAKGNGYGLGNSRLAQIAGWLGVDTLAVGTYAELGQVADHFPGSLLVLTPWRPFDNDVPGRVAPRVVHTVGRVEDLAALLEWDPDARIVLERATSMLRHGLTASGLREAADLVAGHGDVRLEGVALHLPMAGSSHLTEVTRLMNDVVAAGLTPLEAIQTGTSIAARIMGHDAELGTVAEGKLADLLILEPGADPSRDIRDTRRIRQVMVGGRMIERPAPMASAPEPRR